MGGAILKERCRLSLILYKDNDVGKKGGGRGGGIQNGSVFVPLSAMTKLLCFIHRLTDGGLFAQHVISSKQRW